MEQFQQCFVNWVSDLNGALDAVFAIDGKTLRSSFDTATNKAAIHVISAWACEQKLVLGQRKIFQQIIAQKAKYVIGLKANQGTLHEDVELFFDPKSTIARLEDEATQLPISIISVVQPWALAMAIG